MLIKILGIIKFFYEMRISMSITIHLDGNGGAKYEANIKNKSLETFVDIKKSVNNKTIQKVLGEG